MDLSFSGNVNFLPPGGSANSNAPLASAATYGAQSLATIDIPSGTASGTSFAVGFGSVANPVGFVVKNTMPSGGDIALSLNGTLPSSFSIAPGGYASVGQPNRPSVPRPLATAVVYILTTTTAAGTVEVMVFGD